LGLPERFRDPGLKPPVEQGKFGSISALEVVPFVELRVGLKSPKMAMLNYFWSHEFTLPLMHKPCVKP
jgi:hypothetical protein